MPWTAQLIASAEFLNKLLEQNWRCYVPFSGHQDRRSLMVASTPALWLRDTLSLVMLQA
jgi:esterase/lipase